MTDLTTLPHIGPKLAADLLAVGIPDVVAFRAVGPDEAAELLAAAGLHDCGHARRALRRALEIDALTVKGVDNILFDVGDLDEAVDFYGSVLGFGLKFRFDGLALFTLGPEPAGLLVRSSSAPLGGGRVWLEVADARAAAEELRVRGVALAGEPFQVATGWTVEASDAWGNAVGFTDYTLRPASARRPPRGTGLITRA